MNSPNSDLLTPIYLKTDEVMEWPQDKTFYLLSRDGLFLCRNHQFFSSCVPADRWPSELAGHRQFLQFDYPRLSQRLVEQVVGFFDIIGERYGSEAAVLLAWNRDTNQVEVVVPDQIATVSSSYYGKPYGIDLHYDVPTLPSHLLLIGDIHSHVDAPAYASWTDKVDEAYRPGLHLVVGRILDEPPEFYCAVVADGTRFRVKDLALVMEGYRRRRREEVPPEWIASVTVEQWSSKSYQISHSSSSLRTTPLLGSGSGWDESVAVHRVNALSPPFPPNNPTGKGSAASTK
ncbi:MAG TPA: Mov34/MPN/PAD-1 family protein [Candidatus Paceibacterota bacterium]|nr:Mov34/MPN/PAD-1 family protein [Verrucomicrobiota bacterium]HSA11024.1 Mov34/MPN/PAD-1 family protein [Candidatus Paceibacterota bacterium]